MVKREQTTRITIRVAAQKANVEPEIVRHCIEVGLVSRNLTADELAELRRVRRLRDLGVNIPGVEVILRMRRRIEALQSEIDRLQRLTNRPEPSESSDTVDHNI
jgi:MerR family transcriptional regulator/heat shock protein HspR